MNQSNVTPSAPINAWELVESREAFHNRWLHVTLDTVRLPDHLADGVTILLLQ